jgi:putative glutamine amidotransferase
MKLPPVILISPSFELRGVEFKDLSVSLSLRYVQAVIAAGGLPLIAPASVDRSLIAESVRRADGVLLTGGDDINPYLYETKLPRSIKKTIETTPDGGRRDAAELMFIAEIFRQRKPVLAICRGHQMLHIAFGGKLVVDIAQQIPGALNHRRVAEAFEIVHEAELKPGSSISKITGRRRLGVNSTHHQGFKEPADPFIATARSRDGLVEAMELKPELSGAMPFLLGVQFHPERLIQKDGCYLDIFRSLVRAARTSAPRDVGKRNSKIIPRTNGLVSHAVNLIPSTQ